MRSVGDPNNSLAPVAVPRLVVERHLTEGPSTLAADVREGLSRRPLSIPSKHFYDDAGSELFDRICETPEYYPTRVEQGLLDRFAGEIMEAARPGDLVELGSGAARKTHALLDASVAVGKVRYVPLDVSEGMLLRSATELLGRYPWLHVHGIVGDFEDHLHLLPEGRRKLIAFLGGTIGNFDEIGAVRFLSRIARQMGPDDRFLLGTDMVKDRAVLHAAYNDAAGLTAAFNRNILGVVNRQLQADFDPQAFEHRAFFREEKSQIEMHLRATTPQRVSVRSLGMTVRMAAGESIHTEISRKFTLASLQTLLQAAGLAPIEIYTPDNGWFALSLSRRIRG